MNYLSGFGIACVASLLVTVLPIIYIIARSLISYKQTVSDGRSFVKGTSLCFLCTIIMFSILACFSHREVFTGLDSACYRETARLFSVGERNFHDKDVLFMQLPEEVRNCFFYRWKKNYSRATRDLLFEIDKNGETSPFFLAMLPMAAASIGAYDAFVPLIGSLFFCMLFISGLQRNGALGGVLSSMLFFTTFWLMWFFRGFHTDIVAATIISIVMASMLDTKSRSNIDALIYGFALGVSCAYHYSVVVLVGLVVVASLLMREWSFKKLLLMILGIAVGLVPMVLGAIFVCNPYGNLFSKHFFEMFKVVREIRYLTYGLLGFGIIFLIVSFFVLREKNHSRVINFLENKALLIKSVCLTISIAICFAMAFVGGEVSDGFDSFKSGVLYIVPLLALFAFCLFSRKVATIYAIILLLLSFVSLYFVYLKGVEVHVGLWSQRRIFPIIIMLLPIMAAVLIESIKEVLLLRLAFVAVCAISFIPMLKYPMAYIGVNGKGADDYVSLVRSSVDKLDKDAVVVFDYYPHSAPYQASFKRPIFGIGEYCDRDARVGVVDWMQKESANQDMYLMSSYAPCYMEENASFVPVESYSGQHLVISSKGVFPIGVSKKDISNTLYKVQPVSRTNEQYIVFKNGGMLGMRGRWGEKTRDGRWSVNGSGVIGPIPAEGESVKISVTYKWEEPQDWKYSAEERTITITSPFGSQSTQQIFSSKDIQTIEFVFNREMEDDASYKEAGVYEFTCNAPYNPIDYGVKGKYSSDLGIEVIDVKIKVF